MKTTIPDGMLVDSDPDENAFRLPRRRAMPLAEGLRRNATPRKYDERATAT
jgi:hypothetical protein